MVKKISIEIENSNSKITCLISKIASLKYDVIHNRSQLILHVDFINVMLMPTTWIGIDKEGRLHVTYVSSECSQYKYIIQWVDYAWEYIPWEKAYRCIKCREDNFQHGQVVKCINTDVI